MVVRIRGRLLNLKKLETLFPKLRPGNYKVTSQQTPQYNCHAWAAGDQDRWWDPDPQNICHWPPGVIREYTLEAFKRAYQTLEYKECESGDFESGFDKIAIYTKDEKPTSKLGEYLDISHEIDGVSGNEYGEIRVFMKRAKL